MRRGLAQRGNATIEMTLIGIPLIFVLISIFEISRGMWIYHTLSYAARETSRYVSVHGQNCQTTPNTCGITPAQFGQFLNTAATGLEPRYLDVTFISPADNFTCKLDVLMAGTCGAGADCNGLSAIPSCGGGAVGSPVTVTITYPYNSAVSMFWPGAGKGFVFGGAILPSTSQDRVQY